MPVNGLGYPPQNMARVVVWEWLNEHGRWRPYSAAVCHHIENVLKGDARGSVVLGQVDGQLAPYVIDLQSMHQFRQDTGKKFPGGSFVFVCLCKFYKERLPNSPQMSRWLSRDEQTDTQTAT